MRAATEGSLPPVMPQGNLVQVLGREVRQGSPGELMVESTPSRQRRPPCKTNKEDPDEAADAAALTYLLTPCAWPVWHSCRARAAVRRRWRIAKTGHRLGSVGVSAVGSGMASICCRPSR